MKRKYTDLELLNKVKSLVNFAYIPHNYWILGVRSLADETNTFDDKFYVYKGEEFICMTTGTTNCGVKGTAVIKSNLWFYEAYKFGKHRGKMDALRQAKPIQYYRDLNKNGKTDESGTIYNDIIYVNIHGATYRTGADQFPQKIGGWSEGCQVMNNNLEYERIIKLCKPQSIVTYCLIKEF